MSFCRVKVLETLEEEERKREDMEQSNLELRNKLFAKVKDNNKDIQQKLASQISH